MALYQNSKSNELEVVLTLRSTKLRTHGGEVALPGGKKDPTDIDLVYTALRGKTTANDQTHTHTHISK